MTFGAIADEAVSACRLRRMELDFPVSMWLVDLSIPQSDEELSWLSQTELDRAGRFRDLRQRLRYLRLHGALRVAVSQGFAIPAEAQHYAVDSLGRWRILAPFDLGLSFSYSAGYGVIALSRFADVGVDIEERRPISDADSLVETCFDMAEQAAYLSSPERVRNAVFLAGWTRKEAALKVIGTGLQRAPDTLHTGLYGRSATQTDVGLIDLLSFSTGALIGAVATITRDQSAS